MAEQITLQFNVRGKQGIQNALAEVQDALSGVETTTVTATRATQKQGNVAGRVAKKTAEVAAAHAAWELAQRGVAKATGSTITHTTALTQAVTAARGGVSKMGAALSNAAKASGRFALRMGAVVAPLAPFVAGGAVLAGLVGINKALINIAASAANIGPVTGAFDNLARHIGTTGEALRTDLRQAVAGTVPELELMQSSVIALNSGAIKSRETLVEFAEGARILGRTVGVETADAFDRLIRATGLMNPQLLKSLGILVTVDEATRRYADANGLVASQLTDTQRKEAFRLAVLQELRGATSRVGDSTDDLQTSLQRSEAAGETFERGLRSAIAEAEGLKDVAQDMSLVKQGVTELALELGGPLVTSLTNAAAKTLSFVTGPLAGLVEGMREAKGEVEAINTSLEDSVISGVSVTVGDIPTPALPTKAFVDLGDEMRTINRLQTAMGGLFDATTARMNALKEAIKDALSQGWEPLSQRVQTLRRQLQAFRTEVAPGVSGRATFAPPEMPAVRMPDVAGLFEAVDEALGKGVDAAMNFAASTDVVITSFGSMAEAAIRGSQQMEVTIIRSIQNIINSIARQADSGFFSGLGVPFLSAGLGIVSALFSGGGGRDTQPVRVEEFGSRARQQQREDRGPEVVNVNLLDAEGNVIRTIQRIRRREALSGVERLPRGVGP